jgi:hypothetical protein
MNLLFLLLLFSSSQFLHVSLMDCWYFIIFNFLWILSVEKIPYYDVIVLYSAVQHKKPQYKNIIDKIPAAVTNRNPLHIF